MPVRPVPPVARNSDLATVGTELAVAPAISVKEMREEHAEDVDEGNFIRFIPPSGMPINTADGVIVVTCKKDARRRPRHTPRPPKPRTFVPLELGEGISGDEAVDVLLDYRLEVKRFKLVASDEDYGTVIGSNPPIGEEVAEGDRIEVLVSDGGRSRRNSFFSGLIRG